jgi:hypothetical protein
MEPRQLLAIQKLVGLDRQAVRGLVASVMSRNEPITLGKMPLAYVLVVLFVVVPAVWMLAFSNVVDDLWCQHIQLPEYERLLGFRMEARVGQGRGGTFETLAIAWVDPNGPFSAAGVRPGDVPRMYHGVRDFCVALSAASEGRSARIELLNLDDWRNGESTRRIVTIRPLPR